MSFDALSNIEPEKYTLSIKLTYPGQKEEAISENSFQVAKRPARLIRLPAGIIVGAIIVTITIITLIIKLAIILLRKNAGKEKTAKTRKRKD